jgi:hypothetical protein
MQSSITLPGRDINIFLKVRGGMAAIKNAELKTASCGKQSCRWGEFP